MNTCDSIHQMVTRQRDGTRKSKVPYTGIATHHLLPVCLQSILHYEVDEPTCYTDASMFPHWRAAMLDEFNAHLKQRTWFFVPANQAQNVVGCKWIFMIKIKACGTTEHQKTRLVAKGFD